MFGNRLTFPTWTTRKEVADPTCERVDVLDVKLPPAFGRAPPRRRSCALEFSWTLDCERVLAGGVSR